MATFFGTDLLKIMLAKKLKNKMTPRFIFKTKKWVSILITGFGLLMLLQGVFPSEMQKGIEKIPGKHNPLENNHTN